MYKQVLSELYLRNECLLILSSPPFSHLWARKGASAVPDYPAIHWRYTAHPRPGEHITLVALTCSAPPEGRARWTLQLLADRLVALGVVDVIGRECVRTTLNKTTLSRGRSSSG